MAETCVTQKLRDFFPSQTVLWFLIVIIAIELSGSVPEKVAVKTAGKINCCSTLFFWNKSFTRRYVVTG